MGGGTEYRGVGLVYVEIKVRLYEELVGELEGPVDMADASGVVAIDVDCHFLPFEHHFGGLEFGKAVHVQGFFGRKFIDVDLVSDTAHRSDCRGAGDDECSGFQIVGRQVLAVKALLVGGNLAAPFLFPGQMGGVDCRDESVQAAVDGDPDGLVQAFRPEGGGSGLHGDDVIP